MAGEKVYRWSFIDRASIAVINLVTNLILARLLTQADFGYLAMVALFTTIASDISSCGLSDGLIHKPKPTEMDYSTVFIFNAGVGLILGLSFFICAPLIANYFGHEEIVSIMRIFGVSFIFQTMGYVQETRLRKHLKMKTVCFVRVGATLTVSVMAITIALAGGGYYALICTQILLNFFIFVYYTIASRWFPRLQFSVSAFRELFSYGIHLMLAYMATIVERNINTFILGRLYTPAASGVYSQGGKLAQVPYGVSEASINVPFFVVASNELNPQRRRALINEMTSTMLIINFSIIALLFSAAEPIVDCLLSTKWHNAIPIFRILLFAECLFAIKQYFITLCKLKAKTRFVRNLGFIGVAVQLALLAIFLHKGIYIIAATQVAGVAFSSVVYAIYAVRTLKFFTLHELVGIFFRSAWIPLLAAIATAASISIATMPALLGSVIACLTYGIVSLGLGAITHSGLYMLLHKKLKSYEA